MAAELEDLLQLLAKAEALDAKQEEVMRLYMLAMAEMVASGELTPGDPEWKAIVAKGEALGHKVLAQAMAAAEMSTRKVAEYAARPGGEAVAEAHRRVAAGAAALRARAQEYVAFMRDVAVLADSDSDSDSVGLGRAARGEEVQDQEAQRQILRPRVDQLM